MSKLIALILILDFSGSMEQKLIDKTKRQILAENVSALSTTLGKKDRVVVVSYGSKSKSCNSVERNVFNSKQLSTWVGRQHPKKFAMTPLGKSIKKLKEDLKKNKVEQVLIITDGNDTCGEDPCKALKEIDRFLAKNGTRLRLDILGYDLNAKEKTKLSCDTRLELKQMKYALHTADNDVQFGKKLEKIEKEVRQDKPLNGNSSLQVLGTPATIWFEARPLDAESLPGEKKKSWQGPYPVELIPGSYEIQALGLNQPAIKLSLQKNERKELSFFGIFHGFPPVKVTLQGPIVGFEFIPKDQQAGGPAATRSPSDVELVPGRWQLRTTYPKWIEGSFDTEIAIDPGQDRQIDVEKLLAEKIRWVKNETGKDAGLVFKDAKQRWDVLVPFNGPAVPIPKWLPFKWVKQ